MKQTFFQMECNTNQVMGKVFVRDRDNGQTHYIILDACVAHLANFITWSP